VGRTDVARRRPGRECGGAHPSKTIRVSERPRRRAKGCGRRGVDQAASVSSNCWRPPRQRTTHSRCPC
jgi:hypothetical protein